MSSSSSSSAAAAAAAAAAVTTPQPPAPPPPAAQGVAREGDLVLVYQNLSEITATVLTDRETAAEAVAEGRQHEAKVDNRYGAFLHADMRGQMWGTKVHARHASGGWVALLAPTPELWGQALSCRTQIVQETDAHAVLGALDVRAGEVVAESGTGSGAMTFHLARAVGAAGRVHTFEINETRAMEARKDFQRLGLHSTVTVTHRNVCVATEDGGGFGPELDNAVDAVFLDLPSPWDAVENAKRALRDHGRICVYSPCIEQIMQAAEALRAADFYGVRMIESRQKPIEGNYVEMDALCLDPATDPPDVRAAIADNTATQVLRVDGDGAAEPGDAEEQEAQKEQGGQQEEEAEKEEDREEPEQALPQQGQRRQTKKRQKPWPTKSKKPSALSSPKLKRRTMRPYKGVNPDYAEPKFAVPETTCVQFLGRPRTIIRGHTAFLMFASRCSRPGEATPTVATSATATTAADAAAATAASVAIDSSSSASSSSTA